MLSNIFFVKNEMPKGYSVAFTSYFYNDVHYLTKNNETELLTFYILNKKLKQVIGRIHFNIQDGVAISLPKSPFGGFELNKTIAIEILSDFVSFVLETLQKHSVNKIKISTYAQAYDAQASSKINYILLKAGFEILNVDINHHIPIDGNFDDKIKLMQQRKLLKCKMEGLIFKEEDLSKLEMIYSFILKCREEKGQSLSLNYSQIKHLTSSFSSRYKIFSVGTVGKIWAATIVVIVNDELLYNFYPASSEKYNSLSPMVFLTEGLFNYCLDNKYKILDLGTSSLGIEPNKGLINFKEGIGGIPSLKLIFEKSL